MDDDGIGERLLMGVVALYIIVVGALAVVGLGWLIWTYPWSVFPIVAIPLLVWKLGGWIVENWL